MNEEQSREDALIEEIYQYHKENHNFTIERGPRVRVEVQNENRFN